MFQTKVVEKIKAHILCSVTFFENRAFCEIMWKKKYWRTIQPSNDNMANAHCMVDT